MRKRNERGLFVRQQGRRLQLCQRGAGRLENAKNAEGFVKLTELKVGGRTSVEACRSYGVCAAVALGMMLVGAVGMKLVPPQYFGVVERFSVFAATGFNAALGIHLFRGKNAGEIQNDQEEKP